jgi:hypothetical protein
MVSGRFPESAMATNQISLAGIPIHRGRGRNVDQRSEERFDGIVDSAVLFFRGERHKVQVVNISSRGTMIETDLMPRLGEPVLVQFEACSRIQAFVRWAREGRIGLNFGHEIVLSS